MTTPKNPKNTINKNKRNLTIGILVILIAVIFIIWTLSYWYNLPNPGGLGANCVIASGKGAYIQCKNVGLNATTGNISITFEQDSGNTWNMVHFVFENTNGLGGTQPNNASLQSPNVTYVNSVSSGKTITVTIRGLRPGDTIGTPLNGAIWAEYTIQNTTTPQYVFIAVVYLKSK